MQTTKSERSEYLRANYYRGIKIEINPAIQYSFHPDLNYKSEAYYLYVKDGWSYEKSFTAYGYTKNEADRKIKWQIDKFLDEQL